MLDLVIELKRQNDQLRRELASFYAKEKRKKGVNEDMKIYRVTVDIVDEKDSEIVHGVTLVTAKDHKDVINKLNKVYNNPYRLYVCFLSEEEI